MASLASIEQWSLIGGRESLLAIWLFRFLNESYIDIPLTMSVARLEDAMAEPQPNALNFASSIFPLLSTLIWNFSTSPHAGAPTIPVPTLPSSAMVPTFLGRLKWSITSELYLVAIFSTAFMGENFVGAIAHSPQHPMEETVCFYDQNFLSMHPLTSDNVMEYFSTSQFYDKGSLNEILKMQSQFANIDISHKLTTTPGFYYCLEHEEENMYLIAKKRFDGQNTVIMKMYYCMFGYIYCAPTIRSVSEARIIDCLSYLNDALDKYEEKKRFDWLKGFRFREDIRNDAEDKQKAKFVFEVLHEYDLQRGSSQ